MAERIYKNKKESQEYLILDDRHELLDIYRSKCCQCVHFKKWDFFCAAFPDGIPDKYLSGESDHTKIDPTQTGIVVFTPKT